MILSSWIGWTQFWEGIISDKSRLQWKKGLSTTVAQQHCSCYLTLLKQDSSPVIALSLSRALLSNCLGQLFLASWSPSLISHKKLQLFPLTHKRMQPSWAEHTVLSPIVIWSIVQISQVWRSQSKCNRIVGKRTNGTNVQERHEKLLWNNAQGWEVLTHTSQEAKCHNKAW